MAQMPLLDGVRYGVEVTVFILALLMLARKTALGDLASTSGCVRSLILRPYNVLPALLVVTAITSFIVGGDVAFFAEAILLGLTACILLLVSQTEGGRDELLSIMSHFTALLSLMAMGLAFHRLFLAGCLL